MAHIVHIPLLVRMTFFPFFLEFTFCTKKVPELGNLSFSLHVEQPGTGKGILTEDPSVAGLISRADVAALVSDQISGYSQKDPYVPLFLVKCGGNWIYRHIEVDE